MVISTLLDRILPQNKPIETKPAKAWSRTIVMGVMNATTYNTVNIPEDDITRYGPFQFCFIENDSDEDLRIYLDGVLANKSNLVPTKSNKPISGIPYRGVVIYNLSGTNTSANEVAVTVAEW